MMLFCGILAIFTGGTLWLVGLVALGSMAISGDPIKAAVGIAGMILLLTTTTWAAVTAAEDATAPHTMCGASNI